MTEEKKPYDPEDPDLALDNISRYQSEAIGRLLDYNQAIVVVCREQAENWQLLAQAFIKCAQMASDIAESCAVAARVTVDRTGDIISNEFALVETTNYNDDDEDDDDDRD